MSLPSLLRYSFYCTRVPNKGFVFEPLMSLGKSFWCWQERRIPNFSSGSVTLFWCNTPLAVKIISWGYRFYNLEYERVEGQTILGECFRSIDFKSDTCLFPLWLTWCKEEEEDQMTGSRGYKNLSPASACFKISFQNGFACIAGVWNGVLTMTFLWFWFVVLFCHR